jgi:sugar/nucleoside kinase (ribokinase family)
MACDVLGLGCVALDEVLRIERWPGRDAKERVLARSRLCGGITATALRAAAAVGARAAYAGVLGTGVDSQFVLDCLAASGVCVAGVARRAGAAPIHCTVIVDGRGRRTVFYDLASAVGPSADWPPEATISSCRVLLVDPLGVEGMLRAAQLARAAGIAVVADLEGEPTEEARRLAQLADHLIISRAYAAALCGARVPARQVQRLAAPDRDVVVTCGKRGAWYASRGTRPEPRHVPAFTVQEVDTTGCGDVFHGVYAALLAEGRGMPERVRLAAAAAALWAARPHDQPLPSRDEILALAEA